jgi:hypothetical protein
VLLASAFFLYFGGSIVLSSRDPTNTLWGLSQLVSAIAGIAGTVLRQPRFAQVAAAVAAVSILVVLGPTAPGFLTGPPVSADPLLVGLLVVFLIPPLVMMWGAFAMSRTQGSTPRRLDPEPEQRASPQARRSGSNRSGRGSHPDRRIRSPIATSVDDNHADVGRKWAGLVVAIAASTAGLALSSEPRNVPILLASAVALLYGVWLLLGGRATAGRTMGVLVAGLIGGVLGFLPLIDLVGSRARSDIVAEYLSVAGRVGPYAAASGLLFGLVWPAWWWRWGLILSWGFVVASFVAEGFLARAVPLLLVPVPCLAAAAGALIRRVVPMLSSR